MVNWATALNCKRCSYLFQPAETVVAAQATAQIQPQSVPDTIVEQNFDQPNYSQNRTEPQFQSPTVSQPQVSWGNNRQYNQNYGQNYRPPHIPSANPKIGLAVTSMIFGILALATTIFLIGLLFAPIGLILGIVALVKTKKKPNQYGGSGFAIAGIATSALVVLFIPIILAIAIPNLLAARRAANAGSAISAIRTLAGAEETFRTTSGKGACADLKTLGSNNLIDADMAKGERSGYRFSIVNYPLGGCEITATPLSPSDGDISLYYSTDDNQIRAARKNGKPADQHDKLLNDLNEEEEKPKTSGGLPTEGGAIATLRTLQGAQATYIATSGDGVCCGDFQTLAGLGLIKPDLSDGEDAGYRFKINKISPDNFELTATPVSNALGSRSFFLSPRDGLRGAAKNGLPADKKDPPVE